MDSEVTEEVLPRRGGRPSQQPAGLIRERILEIATELILTNGYGATSIEAIAKHARISKRTFYYRFSDKAELFRTVVHRLITRLRPMDTAPLFEGRTLGEILQRIARVIGLTAPNRRFALAEDLRHGKQAAHEWSKRRLAPRQTAGVNDYAARN